jgi:CRISPR/Cas system CSM-associated protein Csm4 (group 5 of RAMP superfamily)
MMKTEYCDKEITLLKIAKTNTSTHDQTQNISKHRKKKVEFFSYDQLANNQHNAHEISCNIGNATARIKYNTCNKMGENESGTIQPSLNTKPIVRMEYGRLGDIPTRERT